MRRIITATVAVALCGLVPGVFAENVNTKFTNNYGKAGSTLTAHVQTGIIPPSCVLTSPHSCDIQLQKGVSYSVKFTKLAWGSWGPEIQTICSQTVHGGNQLVVNSAGVCEEIPRG